MTKIVFEKPSTREYMEVKWPSVPRIGDSVQFSDENGNGGPDGTVKDVVWWSDGSAKVILR